MGIGFWKRGIPKWGGVAQLVRAPHCHCGGRGSESRRSRKIKIPIGLSGWDFWFFSGDEGNESSEIFLTFFVPIEVGNAIHVGNIGGGGLYCMYMRGVCVNT